MFLGFIDEGAASTLPFQLRGNSNEPVEPDAAPTWRVFGANGQVASGTGSASSFESGSITGATNAAPIVITSAAHQVVTGQNVTVASVAGNTAANGQFIATYVGVNTFSLAGSTGNGVYTSGGTWKTTGLYKVALSGAVLNSLEAGKTYTVVLTFTLSAAIRTVVGTFTVR